MRSILRSTVGALLLLLAACGQATTGGVPPTSVLTVAPPPTQAPEATAGGAPHATRPPAPTVSKAPPATSVPQPAAPTTASKATTGGAPLPAGGANDILVIFHRSGGIAGVDETLTVYADGKLVRSGRGATKQAQAAPADISNLQKLLASPEFAALESRYQAVGADLFTYEVTVPSGGKPKTVITMDGAQNPPMLDEVLQELGKLAAQVR